LIQKVTKYYHNPITCKASCIFVYKSGIYATYITKKQTATVITVCLKIQSTELHGL